MKKRLFFMAMGALALQAAEVSVEQAKRAVGCWLTADPALGCRLGHSVAAARACTQTNGATFHVVKLNGGGFVVTSADTKIEPVIAFSESEDLVEDERNPLWVLLTRDMAARAKVGASNGGASLMSAAPLPESTSEAEEKWAKLLSDDPVLMGQGLASISDVRVAPLVQSTWNQGDVGSDRCYNYYTPGNAVCGCVATAGAQLMRYFEWPRSSTSVPTFTCGSCSFNGATRTLTTQGGTFNWSDMPYSPTGSMTEIQRQTIGRLTSDIGIICSMKYTTSTGSGTGGYMLCFAFDHFGYSNALAYQANGDISGRADLKNALVSNFDAKLPVALSLDGAGGHEIVADGYGYSGNTLYYHFNMGWSGRQNAWYAPPKVANDDYQFNVVDGFVYNIYTNQAKGAVICSGRVLSGSGTPISQAIVQAKQNGVVKQMVSTDANGIYALILPAGSYAVTASSQGYSASRSVTLKSCVALNLLGLDSGHYGSFTSYSSSGAVGNRCNQDITLTGVASVVEPIMTPGSCLFYPSTNVTISCATQGATIHYTLDGTDPTENSEIYLGAIFIDDDTTIRARAFKSGMNPSVVVSCTYTYDNAQGAPKGDYFDNPIVISGASGSRKIDDTSTFTYEPGEPWHTSQGGSRYYEYRSAWFRWTAPGTGPITFSTDSKLVQGYSTTRFPVFLAVYTGDSLTSISRLAFATKHDGDYVTRVTLDVSQGTVYRIVIASGYEALSGYYNLQWSGNLTVMATATDSSDTTVAVPYEWLSQKLGSRLPANPTAANYTTLALADTDGDGFANWKEYLCGTEPAQKGSLPQCTITMNGNVPVVSHNVRVPSEAAAQGWTAVLKGSATLSGWTTANPSAHRFFKVVIEKQ